MYRLLLVGLIVVAQPPRRNPPPLPIPDGPRFSDMHVCIAGSGRATGRYFVIRDGGNFYAGGACKAIRSWIWMERIATDPSVPVPPEGSTARSMVVDAILANANRLTSIPIDEVRTFATTENPAPLAFALPPEALAPNEKLVMRMLARQSSQPKACGPRMIYAPPFAGAAGPDCIPSVELSNFFRRAMQRR